MPRERVHHGKMYVIVPEDPENPPAESTTRLFHPGEDLPNDARVQEESSLDVSWNRDGEWVQIGFTAPRDWWQRFIASHINDEGELPYSAWTDVLTRQELNHMIRTLRRARDAAYGADE